jgi:predicted membrane-bound spermidine synthase
MSTTQKRIFFLLFLLSGFSGLVYQVVWLRLAFAGFGVLTPVVSVVLSVFMAGLALGSVVGGSFAARFLRGCDSRALLAYGICELLIGGGAFVVPFSFHRFSSLLLSFGEMNSAGYLVASSVVIACALLPWCFLMGTTFPLMVEHIRNIAPGETAGFSFLYLANVIGAMAGTSLSALVLIEQLGFRGTLTVAALSNLCIALISFVLFTRKTRTQESPAALPVTSPVGLSRKGSPTVALTVLFVTGFCSMAMEVAWTRAFTPITKTTIYAFAFLVTVYLLATWIGSLVYRIRLARKSGWDLSRLLPWAAVASVLPLIINDPNLNPTPWHIFLSLLPISMLLGYITPMLVDRFSGGDARLVGRAYGVNVIGCILGPLVAAYLLLPGIGLKGTLLILALPFYLMAIPCLFGRFSGNIWKIGAMAAALVLALRSETYEEKSHRFGEQVRRDYAATVIARGKGMDRRLFVNACGMTYLTPVTKMMAHYPLALMERKPESVLTICFGMGTTFRSLSSWGADTTAVELVPGVRDLFPYFHEDAAEVLARPNARIVIDDGRRFLKRTSGKYDFICIDPPPPVEAAGSSLLYSREFYTEIKAHLKPGGICQAWYPGGDTAVLLSIVRAIGDAFPHVRVYRSLGGWGYQFLASDAPIPSRSPRELVGRLPSAARADMMEWLPENTPEQVFGSMNGNELSFDKMMEAARLSGVPMINDDCPFNEYYLLRRWLARRDGTYSESL